MKNKILVAFTFISLAAYLSYQYVYQEGVNVISEKTQFQLNSDSLYTHFSSNLDWANQTYSNQIIEVSGVVKSTSKNLLILNPGIVCKLDSNTVISEIQLNDTIEIKGRCLGFDDLFEEVKIDKVIIDW